MDLFELVNNVLSTIKGKVTGQGYITHNDGYPIYHASKDDILRREVAENKKRERQQQILTFKLEDMMQFDDLPFLWNKDILYANNIAYLPLTNENREVALYYIKQIADLIRDAKAYIPNIEHCTIRKKQIDFNYPNIMHYPQPPCSFLECLPYTPTGKKSKYPVVLHFRTSRVDVFSNGAAVQMHPVSGIIKILCDGQIGAASVTFVDENYERIKFSISLFGLSLVIRRVDSDYGNMYRFESIKNQHTDILDI